MHNTEKIPALVMKPGVKSALKDGKKIALDAAPLLIDGEVLVPTAPLPENAKYASTRVVNGSEYAPIDALRGIYVKYDTMGVIILDGDKAIESLNRKEDMGYMLDLIGAFIFDFEHAKINTSEYAPATEEERAAFKRVGADLKARLLAHTSGHPYIHANKAKFDKLREAYHGKNSPLKEYVTRLVERAEKVASEEFYQLTEDEGALKSPLVNPLAATEGYDVGGRMTAAEGKAGDMITLAFGYQITGKQRYAKLAYYIGEALGEWLHWGPGHFLNCAGAAQHMAVAYDWLYNGWKQLKLNTGTIKHAIFTHGIHQGWLSVVKDTCDYPSKLQGTGWRFKNKPDNWNAVNNGNLCIANLVLLTEDADEYVNEEELLEAEELLGANLISLTHDGLVLKQYAPDGSYVESPSYWAYGTNALFRALGALHTTLGSDLGIHHAAGLDKTCYYALNTESADFVGWNYHDGSLSGQDTSMFNVFATVSGDSNLYAIRSSHLKRGKNLSVYDLLYHPDILGVEIPSLDDMPLDYFMEGIDAFTVRNGWGSGSLYAGIIGGYNPKGGSHNHIDSGTFVYHNKGVLWLTDLGSDYYNIVGGYFGNNNLYKRNAEGHNVIFMKDLTWGQKVDTVGNTVEYKLGDNPHIIIDNKEVYGEGTVRGLRGMLLTNERKTLVIQDEIEFDKPRETFLAAHFKSSDISAEITDGGRGVVLRHKDGESIKLTALGTDGIFEITDCYTFLLDSTASYEGEHSRADYSRLLVRFGEAEKINYAMVLESLDDKDYPAIIPMSEWKNI